LNVARRHGLVAHFPWLPVRGAATGALVVMACTSWPQVFSNFSEDQTVERKKT
jgi:hypothetical protein